MNVESEASLDNIVAPIYLPTLELSKKKMMSTPSNIVTVRELVKARQEERKKPVSDAFVQRMEDSLMRWKPPISSHQGTTMAVDGTHPFQLPTGKMPSGPGRRDVLIQGPDGSIAYRSLNRWWRQRVAGRPKCGDSGTSRNDHEDDCYSFDFGEENNNNDDSQHVDTTTARTPYGFPEPVMFSETSKEDREIIFQNEQEIYQQYYRNPIPDDYLSVAHNSDTLSHPVDRTSFIDGIKSCFPLCTDI